MLSKKLMNNISKFTMAFIGLNYKEWITSSSSNKGPIQPV